MKKKKKKGVNKNVVSDVLFNKKLIRQRMKRIQRKLHKIETYEIFKIYLSCFDDKRYKLGNGINSLPYFHGDI